MSAYNPPTENVPIFDSSLFRQENTDGTLTINIADKRYLRFPIGQGAETIPSLAVQGQTQTATCVITNANGATSNGSLSITDTSTGKAILENPNTSSGSYNFAVPANGGSIITKGSAINSDTLTLTTWSSTYSGVNITPTSVSMGAGSASTNPTTEVECDGTNVIVKPDIKFPDNTIQNSAFTGAHLLAGSYTLTNMTIDSNGKITALSNGTSSSQFQPTFNNSSVLQVIGSNYGYTALQYINFTGGWGINDYICFRVSCCMTWGNYGSGQYSNFATQNGLMYIYPYAMPGGVFSGANAGTQTIIWGNNTGTYSGWGNGKICNFVSNGSAGNCGYMTFYGSGTQNGGYLQFFFPNPGSTFNVSLALEYLYRTGSGGGHNITNGASYGQPYYYNQLP